MSIITHNITPWAKFGKANTIQIWPLWPMSGPVKGKEVIEDVSLELYTAEKS